MSARVIPVEVTKYPLRVVGMEREQETVHLQVESGDGLVLLKVEKNLRANAMEVKVTEHVTGSVVEDIRELVGKGKPFQDNKSYEREDILKEYVDYLTPSAIMQLGLEGAEAILLFQLIGPEGVALDQMVYEPIYKAQDVQELIQKALVGELQKQKKAVLGAEMFFVNRDRIVAFWADLEENNYEKEG